MSNSAVAVETLAPKLPELNALKVMAIEPDPDNPRKTFSQEAMAELMESVKKIGVKVPVLVRPMPGGKWRLVSGERRWRASRAAGRTEILAIIEQMSDAEAFERAVMENKGRDDLTPLDEGEAYKTWLKKDTKLTAEAIAQKIGCSVETVYMRMKLASTKGKVRKYVADGLLPATLATCIARYPTQEIQEKALAKLEEVAPAYNGTLKSIPFEAAKDILDREFNLRLARAPWKLDDAELLPKAGACSACPKRTGANRELFKDIKGDTCLDGACFQAKTKLAVQAKTIELAAKLGASKGLVVLSPEDSAKALRDPYTWADADAADPLDLKGRTWRELAGKKLPVPVVAVDGNGRAHELVKVDELYGVLRESGYVKRAPYVAPSAEDREKERAKLDREYAIKKGAAQRAYLHVAEAAAESKQTSASFLRDAIAIAAAGLPGREAFRAPQLTSMREPQLRKLLVELLIGPGYLSGGYAETALRTAAERFDVDLKKLEAEERKAFDAKAKEG